MSLTRSLLQFTRYVSLPTTQRAISSTACVCGMKAKWRAPFYRELYHRDKILKRLGKAPADIRSEYVEWNYDAELYAFGQRLQEKFEGPVLRQALTDQSYIEKETKHQVDLGVESPALDMLSNSELSTSGKALINDYSLKYLRASLPLLPEEGIRSITEYLMSVKIMSDVGHGIGLKDLILTEEHPPSSATVARAFESVVAAINVSSGIGQCQQFIQDFVMTQLVGKDVYDIWEIEEPQSVLSDILERSGRGKPEPRLVFNTGRRTLEAVYQVAIYSDKEFIGTGYGENIDVAVEQAACDGLRRFFQTTASAAPLPFGKTNKKLNICDKENLPLCDWSISKADNVIMC